MSVPIAVDRLDAEDEDQQRRHQRAAAHAGHADEQADAEPEGDQREIHAESVEKTTGGHAPGPPLMAGRSRSTGGSRPRTRADGWPVAVDRGLAPPDPR